MSLIPKNWDSFQHYKDRSPAWIKLHRGLLDDFAFSRLPVASRALAPLLWLLASEYEHGKITASVEEIAFRLRTSESELAQAIKPLIECGFFTDDSDLLAGCKHGAIPEERRGEIQEEKEGEKISSLRSERRITKCDEFETWWENYPRKSAKGAAKRAYQRVIRDKLCDHDTLLQGCMRYAAERTNEDQKFTKHPATWLNAACWTDEVMPKGQNNGTGNIHDRIQGFADEARELERSRSAPRSDDVCTGDRGREPDDLWIPQRKAH